MKNEQIQLHDIKDLLEINDNSFFLFIAIILIGIILILSLLFFIIKFLKNKQDNIKKEYYNELQMLDFSNAKEAAYSITKYGRILANSNREKKVIEELIEELEKYKYKKEVNEIDKNIKAKLSNFLDLLDVK